MSAAAMATLLGCGPALPVSEVPQSYDRIPPRVQRILVVPFEGDARWGNQAAVTLSNQLRREFDQYGDLLLRNFSVVGPDRVPLPAELRAAPAEGVSPSPDRSGVADPTALRELSRRLSAAEIARLRGRAASADAVLYGTVQIFRVRPEDGPPDGPERITVLWRAELIDVATREVYARMTLSETLPPTGADPAGRPSVDRLERRPYRRRPATTEEALFDVLSEMADRFRDEFREAPKIQRARLDGDDHIFSLEGLYFLANGDTERAFDAYRRALTFKPSDAASLHNLGAISEHRGDPVAALRDYEAALASDPERSAARRSRDRVFAKTRNGPAVVPEE